MPTCGSLKKKEKKHSGIAFKPVADESLLNSDCYSSNSPKNNSDILSTTSTATGSIDSLENDDFYTPIPSSLKKRFSRQEHLDRIRQKKGNIPPGTLVSDKKHISKLNLLIKKFVPNHSKNINEESFVTGNDRSLEGIIKTEIPDWKTSLAKSSTLTMDSFKSPLVIIVCMSAIRAIDLIKMECKAFSSLCKIGKLFAKHFSLEEQKSYLRENEVRVVVGTPHRLSLLLSENCLTLSCARVVVFDLQKDSKGRTLLESNDTCKDVALFSSKYLLPILSPKTKLCMLDPK